MNQFDPVSKLILQPEYLVAVQQKDWSLPPALVEISPTNSCNASCDWCFYVHSSYKQHHSQEHLPLEVLKRTLSELRSIGCKAVSWSGGGDPSVYPWINDAISHAHELGLKQGMFTNAYKPISHPEFLDWIRVTVTEKFVITKHVAEYAKKTHVGVNFNLSNSNRQHLDSMVEQAKLAGVQYFQFRPALADTFDQQETIERPDAAALSSKHGISIEDTDYKWQDYLSPHGYSVCFGHLVCPFIWFDGRVDVCAYHHSDAERYSFGNLNENSFAEIWSGSRRLAMLEAGIPVTKQCQHCCKNHLANRTLAFVAGEISPPLHREFI